ncbi:MAG: fumarate hydratase [Christensenellales bacterium]|jgi:fumarate hydratase subunit alpha
MRVVEAERITSAVDALFLQANYQIGEDIRCAVGAARRAEGESEAGKAVLSQLLENYAIAERERIAICQDTGIAVVFFEIGQDVRVTGGGIRDAIDEGVRRAYRSGYLRKSVVCDPLYDRVNTGDNTPAVIHFDIVSGDRIRIEVAPKGFGSENMSAVRMFSPSDGEEGIVRFARETVERAGPNPCPPVIVGMGIGGTMEQAAIIAKRALTRPIDVSNPDARYAALEDRLLREINRCGVGPAGLGGRTTCLKVQIETKPTHIAGMPVAINMCCHACRHAEMLL